MSELETRFFKTEVRAMPAEGEATPQIIGLAAVFDKRSENLGGFFEIIKPGAFDGIMDQDIRAFFNHDPNVVLGRTHSDTLQLEINSEGLQYTITPPETQLVKDMVITPIQRRDVSQSSFTFQVDRSSDGEHWYEDDDGAVIREIRRFKRVLDVGPVSIPAYPDATTAARSLKDFKNSGDIAQALTDRRNRELTMAINNI